MERIQQALNMLQEAHLRLKQQYQDEVQRLQRNLNGGMRGDMAESKFGSNVQGMRQGTMTSSSGMVSEGMHGGGERSHGPQKRMRSDAPNEFMGHGGQAWAQSAGSGSGSGIPPSMRDSSRSGHKPTGRDGGGGKAGKTNASGESSGTFPGSTIKPGSLNWSWKVRPLSKEDAAAGAITPKLSLVGCGDVQSVACCVNFSKDGQYLVTSSEGIVHVLDVETFRTVVTWHRSALTKKEGELGVDAYIRAVCFSEDSQRVAAGMEGFNVKVYSLLNPEEAPMVLTGHTSDIYSLEWVGSTIASGGSAGLVLLWNGYTGERIRTLAGNADTIATISMRPDGERVAAASVNKLVFVWDVSSGSLLHRLGGHTESVYAVAFSPDGKQLVTGGLDNKVLLWGMNKAHPRSKILGEHSDYVISVCFSSCGRYIMSGSKDKTAVVWHADTCSKAGTLSGFKNSIIDISACAKHTLLATASGDNLVCIWDLQPAKGRSIMEGSTEKKGVPAWERSDQYGGGQGEDEGGNEEVDRSERKKALKERDSYRDAPSGEVTKKKKKKVKDKEKDRSGKSRSTSEGSSSKEKRVREEPSSSSKSKSSHSGDRVSSASKDKESAKEYQLPLKHRYRNVEKVRGDEEGKKSDDSDGAPAVARTPLHDVKNDDDDDDDDDASDAMDVQDKAKETSRVKESSKSPNDARHAAEEEEEVQQKSHKKQRSKIQDVEEEEEDEDDDGDEEEAVERATPLKKKRQVIQGDNSSDGKNDDEDGAGGHADMDDASHKRKGVNEEEEQFSDSLSDSAAGERASKQKDKPSALPSPKRKDKETGSSPKSPQSNHSSEAVKEDKD
jgi:WD40 repeat protein